MRRLASALYLSDLLCLAGAACIAVTIYILWGVWVWAYVGVVLIVVGVLRDMGSPSAGESRGSGASGTHR